MAPRKKAFPRATVRKILKGHAQKKIGKSVDAIVFLDYILFMTELMRNAEFKAKAGGEKHIAARDIRKVTLSTLRKLRG